MKQISDEYLESLIGLTKNEAINKCDSYGYTVRVCMEDGVGCMVTMDFVFKRANLYIEKGLVTKADRG